MIKKSILILFAFCFVSVPNLWAETSALDFEYDLPANWLVVDEPWGLRFTLPKNADSTFPPEIVLRVRKGPIYIDDRSGAEFAGVIKKQLETGGWSNVYLQSPRVYELKSRAKALIYYANVEAFGVKLVQSHVVFSSPTKHFVFSYTDLPEAFEKGRDSVYNQAWTMVNSVKLNFGNGPTRGALPFLAMLIFTLFLACIFGFFYLRRYFSKGSHLDSADFESGLSEAVELIEVRAEPIGLDVGNGSDEKIEEDFLEHDQTKIDKSEIISTLINKNQTEKIPEINKDKRTMGMSFGPEQKTSSLTGENIEDQASLVEKDAGWDSDDISDFADSDHEGDEEKLTNPQSAHKRVV